MSIDPALNKKKPFWNKSQVLVSAGFLKSKVFKTCTNAINIIWAGESKIYANIQTIKWLFKQLYISNNAGFDKNKVL